MLFHNSEVKNEIELVVESITKNWGSFSLKNINLRIDDAENVVVLGPTGAGKTLLFETVMGYIHAR